MADDVMPKDPAAEPTEQPTLVERWLADQQAWQKTALTYLDSMVKNDEFLVHLGNAMRGSLLAGKPYPTAPAPGAAEPLTETDERIDEILHALHQIQGELADLRTAVERLEQSTRANGPANPGTPAAPPVQTPGQNPGKLDHELAAGAAEGGDAG